MISYIGKGGNIERYLKAMAKNKTKQNTGAGKQAAPAVKTTPDMADVISQTAELRRDRLKYEYPEVTLSAPETVEMYHNRLVEQYKALRKEEYEQLCLRVGLDSYNTSRTYECLTKKRSNNGIYNGYKELEKIAPEFNQELVNRADSAFVSMADKPLMQTPKGQYLEAECNRGKSGNIYCCAVSANAVAETICHKFGYAGKKNLIQPFEYFAGAQMLFSNPSFSGYNNKQAPLKTLLNEGKAGPGSIISVPSSGNTVSGRHALVIAAVEKDKNGKVVSYTVQGNNYCSLRTYGINDSFSSKVAQSVNTSAWAQKRIESEVQGMTDDQLKQMIAETRQRLDDGITNLQQIETDVLQTSIPVNVKLENGKGANFGTQQAQYGRYYRQQFEKLQSRMLDNMGYKMDHLMEETLKKEAAEPVKPLIEEQPEQNAENKRAELRSGLAADAAAAVKKEDEAAKRRTLAASLKEDKEEMKSPAEMAESYSADKDNLFVKKNNNTKKNVNPLLLQMAKENAGAGR